MKAIVYDEYGSPDDVLELRDVDKPEVGDDEVLVRVHASSANRDDLEFVRGELFARPTTGLLRCSRT
jgi:NADPH:quinone reductase-like Zn-dependent oxidoreductase